jgi:hypothetical protein
MALIGNYAVINKTPGRFLSGTALSGDRDNYSKAGMHRNKFLSFAKFNAVPNGYSPGYCFVPAQTSGGIASYTAMSEEISTTAASLASGINIVAALDAAIVLTSADLAQIVGLLANLTASIGITDAQLAAVAGLQASISASMTLTDAQLGAIVDLIAALSAQGSFTNANDFATAEISADISSLTPLSPQSLATALWNSVAADYNETGTMGEKLNDAGSASNPWTEVIESGYTATEVLRILLAVAAGKTDIVDTGSGTATVTFRDVNDTKNRVSAEMTGSERTTITLNPT